MNRQAGLALVCVAAAIAHDAAAPSAVIACQGRAIDSPRPGADFAWDLLCQRDLEALIYRRLGWDRVAAATPGP